MVFFAGHCALDLERCIMVGNLKLYIYFILHIRYYFYCSSNRLQQIQKDYSL